MPDDLRKPLSKSELRRLLPSTKDDLAAVQSLIDLGYPTVEPILYDLLKWIRQDSWPVARPLSAFLVKIGPALAPQVHASLRSRDSTLKAVVLKTIVNDWPKHEIVLLSPELHMLATDGQSWGADLLALRLLARHGIGDQQWIVDWLSFKRDYHQARLSEIESILQMVQNGAD